jgi:glycine dehydrogenase subunit 1
MDSYSYIPNTEEDIEGMLSEIGVEKAEDLFSHIPQELMFKGSLNLPKPLSEQEVLDNLSRLSYMNADTRSYTSFLGGGVYNHFIPPVVSHLVGRSEFYTSYTPYQPEVSQGTLQAIFEYQTLMCMLTGMEVSNASLYDGASATAEAVLMAGRVTGRKKIILSRTLNPQYRDVIKTYCRGFDGEIFELPYDESGKTDIHALDDSIDGETSCVVVQLPNFFGIIEDLEKYEPIVHKNGALFIVAFSEPVAFGIIKPPGDFGADVACGEGQSLGLPPGYGGPYLGIFTSKGSLVRNIPGRIVGESVDAEGRRAFVLTLSAREQHIRREKATSNICTNEGLCALAATVYLSALGKQGIRKIALINHKRSEYAKRCLKEIGGFHLRFNSPTFNEFVIRSELDPAMIERKLIKKKIIPGFRLGRYFRELGDCLLVTVTEMNTIDDIERFCEALKGL